MLSNEIARSVQKLIQPAVTTGVKFWAVSFVGERSREVAASFTIHVS